MERPTGGEECEWGWSRCPGAGAMGNGLSYRKTQRRDRQCHLRQHPHTWRRGAGEIEALGVAWNDAWTGVGDSNVEPAGLGGGLPDGLATNWRAGVDGEGDTTLGGSCVGTLGRPGIGIRVGWKEGGASSRHESKMSRRVVMASTWEMLVGGDAPVRAPVTT